MEKEKFRMIVIIPAYQPDEKLVGVVHALHEQTDYDIVIVNDGSKRDACRFSKSW
jgi:glycosyltransferase involved in cell wall biosynthesis